MTTTAHGAPLEVLHLVLGAIAVSPSNPRSRIDGDELLELAASVRVHGILQPVTVRPTGHVPPYELVFGHRRYHAAAAAGLDRIPALVRELGDDETLELQLVENIQRKDLSPLDEARGYRTLRDRFGYTPETIAERAGRSRSWVHERLKLCELEGLALRALEAGVLTSSHAVRLARLPAHLQDEALTTLSDEAGGWFGEAEENDLAARIESGILPLPSVQECTQILARRFHRELKRAPFDRDDAQLLPEAGACPACPKLVGNCRDLWGDSARADVCTDPPCYERKAKRTGEVLLERALASGDPILKREDVEGSRWIEPLAEVHEVKGEWLTAADLLPEDQRDGLRRAWQIDEPAERAPIEFWDAEDLAHRLEAGGQQAAAKALRRRMKEDEEPRRAGPSEWEIEHQVRLRSLEIVREQVRKLTAEQLEGFGFEAFLRILVRPEAFRALYGVPIAQRGEGGIEALDLAELKRLALHELARGQSLGFDRPQALAFVVELAGLGSVQELEKRAKKERAAAARAEARKAKKAAQGAGAAAAGAPEFAEEEGAWMDEEPEAPAPEVEDPQPAQEGAPERSCPGCGCTDSRACEGGCAWLKGTVLCSKCAGMSVPQSRC